MEVLADRQLVISLQGNSWTIWNFEGEKPHLVENVKYTTGMLLSGRLLPLSDSLAISYQLLLSPGVVPVYHSKIVLVDLHTGAELQEFGGLPGEVYELAALSGCDFLLGSSDDGVLIAWNIRGGSKVWRIEEPDDPVCAIVVLPGCRRALVGSDSGLMRLLDIANGTEMLRLSGHTNKITGFAVLDDGRFAVSCSLDRTLRVWDLEFGKAISLLILDDAILSLSVACDNRTVAIGDASGKVSGFRLR
jgi:WD40 repeat protein